MTDASQAGGGAVKQATGPKTAAGADWQGRMARAVIEAWRQEYDEE